MMIDILNVIVYGGGPCVIASLVAYWTVKAGHKTPQVKRKLLAAASQ